MNKKSFITALLAIVSLTMASQKKLIRIDSGDIALQKKNRQVLFYNKEKARLLMPPNAAFGVECHPSFSAEWTLTYDSVAHALIYSEAQKSIWQSTYEAMHKTKIKKTENWEIIESVQRKHPKGYVAPEIKTFSLTIDASLATMLKAMWTNAISTSEPKKDNMIVVDGTTWVYFVGEQRAKARTEDYSIVKLTNKLVEAIKAKDVRRCDSLVCIEFQRVQGQ